MASPLNADLPLRREVADPIAQACAVVRRADWDARPPVRLMEPDWNYDSIVVHYTGHEVYGDMRAIQAFDLDHRHWDDVAYHYAISPNGRIYEGRELVFKGSHVRLQNTGKIGVVCMGDFDSGWRNLIVGKPYEGDAVHATMLASLKRLSRTLQTNFPLRTFGGHLEYGDSATCPGAHLLPKVQALRSELGLAAPVHRSL